MRRCDLLGGEAEEEEIFRPHFFPDLDVGPVQGADGQGPVQGEFHVPGAGGLLAGRGDLFGKVRRRVDGMGMLDIEVGIENDFQAAVRDPGRR